MMLIRILCVLLGFNIFLASQTNDEVNKIFDQGLKDFNAAKWTSALISFEKIASEFPLNPKTSLSLLFTGKANLKLSKYKEAEQSLVRLLKEFPQSNYFEEASVTLAKVYLDQKQFIKAFWQLCNAMVVSDYDNSNSSIRKTTESIALNYLSAAEIKSIHDTTLITEVKPFLLLITGKIYLARQNNKLAQEIFSKLVLTYPGSYEKPEAEKLAKELSAPKNDNENFDVVGVVLPLTSSQSASTAASQILEGIKYSLSEYNEGRNKKIGLLIRDTELNRSKLEEINEEFKEVVNLRCIVGPIFSSEVKDALEVFKDITVPIVSPTATDDYLTESHESFFQANPSFISRGRLMAQYVYFVGNKRKIAVLNAIDGYSPILSGSFAQEFEALGGKIVLRQSYRSQSVDLKEQIKKISEVQNQIDGLYIPLADKVDIPIVVSYLSQLNLDMPIYGDQDWINASGVESASFLNNNLIFCSDYFLKFDDQDYQSFSKSFYSKTKMDVNRNVLYGYDTMKYLLTILRTSYSSSNAVMQKMISGISSTGFHNNVCFDSKRINLYMNIVRYASGKFELIDKFKLNN